MYVATFHAKGYSDQTVGGYQTAEKAMRSGKLRLKNQESGTVAVYETGGAPSPVALANKENWKWTTTDL
ncbi:hypothetical protein [uncultured Thiodictyon sp.]|uniref:hypothetical protein n=1 Tax=uncultured Thiodictyon sp. TaxID=1846217 RepID=UPI0025DE34D6|nr:hypothetical protein [uncultured Thiodictyon sp.]